MHADRHVVTVVIPTLGRGSLPRTLDALARQSRLPDEVLKILDRDRRGVAWGRNEGIRRAKGDLIAFTDDDCIPGPEWLVPAAVKQPLLSLVDAIRDLGHPLGRSRAQVIGLSLTGHLFGILLFLFFARGLDISLSLPAAGYTRSMLLLAGMLPLSIGGFGVREGGMILLLRPYGVTPERAVALAFLLLGRDLIGICVGGWLELRPWLTRDR